MTYAAPVGEQRIFVRSAMATILKWTPGPLVSIIIHHCLYWQLALVAFYAARRRVTN
jgi:hypothetical protein